MVKNNFLVEQELHIYLPWMISQYYWLCSVKRRKQKMNKACVWPRHKRCFWVILLYHHAIFQIPTGWAPYPGLLLPGCRIEAPHSGRIGTWPRIYWSQAFVGLFCSKARNVINCSVFQGIMTLSIIVCLVWTGSTETCPTFNNAHHQVEPLVSHLRMMAMVVTS